jgi:hypothetical protein
MTITHVLSDDRRELRVSMPVKNGTHHVTVGWDHPCTDEELALALEMGPDLASNGITQVGQTQNYKRIPTRVGIFYVGYVSGPPTWWWPRGSLFKWGARLGWLRLGFHVSYRRKGRDF